MGGGAGHPLRHRALAGPVSEFSGILVACHKPTLRKESHQMFRKNLLVKVTLTLEEE